MYTNWKKILISPATPIIDTMRLIDEVAMQIVLVVDEGNRLMGTVTDGDIRRAILKGNSLEEPVQNVMNTRPTAFKSDESREDMLVAMRLLKISKVPIIDNGNRVVGLEILDELLKPKPRDNPVVLMAGGLGSRLGSLTKDCPKPLLPIGGQPVLQTILESFISFGFHRFYFSVNYKAEMIKQHFGDGSRWNVEIQYIEEDKRMGTAGALSLLPEKPDMPFFVMNGDILTKVNFLQLLEFHADHRAVATMCAFRYDMQIPYGVLQVDKHRLVEINEKPVQSFFVNAGIYVLSPETLQHIPTESFYDMPTLFEKLIHDNKETAVFPLREYWLDIGQITDFKRAQGDFANFFKPKEDSQAE
ncbi:MAG: nucleotidyltransferase family protein [Desulfobulbaceae bacterium]|nr:nucleotidyltransferase family protein [Desulfobulbaceae bacterium]